jgi:hypothetical protein
MAAVGMFGSVVYNNQEFKDHMNSYYSKEKIRSTVAMLSESNELDMKSLEYGQYQPVLSPLSEWPNNSGSFWKKAVSKARLSLTGRANTDALSKDEPNVKPLTRCALLDAAVRKCFNSNPPIPMEIDVAEQPENSPDKDQHDIILDWQYGTDGKPVLLKFTMVCAYMGSEKK